MLWSRLGPWDTAELDRLLWDERRLFEWNAFVYPMEDLPLWQSRMRRFFRGDTARDRAVRSWLARNEPARRHVLRELRKRGPLLGRELDDRSTPLWNSTTWFGNRSLSQLLEVMNMRGEIAVAGRRGGQRLWDLADRWYPRAQAVRPTEAERRIAANEVRALGIARRGDGIDVRVRGVPGRWVIDPDALERVDDPVPDRTALLSPFDRLIHDRDRAERLWDFRYRIEIYVPKEKREYGYFVLPVLRGERLVGRIDPEYDRRARVLRVHRVSPEPDGDLSGLDDALASLASFLGAESIERPRD